ncbi:unnamed protein product [Paramecium sonneborni]|uniref:Uncharacterized protein n=1 Tax=Paramecium sonneborni TaxID=65129 RepID=A0A8S1NZ59_9CILI|nr:unnamed protein product [Paramecium sonneborni]
MSSPDTNSNRNQTKKKTKLNSNKSYSFYDSFVTRKDIIKLASLETQNQQKEFLKTVILRFELGHKKGGVFTFPVYELISFQYYQTQTISKATEESQQQCKFAVFSEYLLQMYNQLKKYTFEQISAFMSIGFYIFVESLERKITQIDSYEIFKRLLRPNILLTNTYNLPIFTQEHIMEFNKFMTNYFYRYYSLYELRMTTYQEVNIFSRLKGENPVQIEKNEDKDSIQEEDELNFKDVEVYLDDDVQPEQEVKKINEKDEEQIEKLLEQYKLNWNNRLDGSQLLQEAEKILTKKK